MPPVLPETPISAPTVDGAIPATTSELAHAPAGRVYDLQRDGAAAGYHLDMSMDFGRLLFGMNMNGMSMGMSEMDGMGMSGMELDTLNAAPSGGGGSGTSRVVGMEFEDAFTDDDFSSFDRPPPTASTSRLGGEHKTIRCARQPKCRSRLWPIARNVMEAREFLLSAFSFLPCPVVLSAAHPGVYETIHCLWPGNHLDPWRILSNGSLPAFLFQR